jgi:hypothetical protein
VALCAVWTVHVETRSAGFLIEPENQGRWFVSGLASKPLVRFVSGFTSKPLGHFVVSLASKPVVTVSIGLASKPTATVCDWFGLKTTQTLFAGLASKLLAMVSGGFTLKPDAAVFAGLASKLVATVFSSLASKLVVMVSPDLASKSAVVFLVEPQNQGGREFLSLGLKTGSSTLVIWALKSPRQFSNLGLKIKWALVCRLCHKIDGGRSVRNKRRDLAACFVWK